MKKEVRFIFISLSLLIILCSYPVSATTFFEKITSFFSGGDSGEEDLITIEDSPEIPTDVSANSISIGKYLESQSTNTINQQIEYSDENSQLLPPVSPQPYGGQTAPQESTANNPDLYPKIETISITGEVVAPNPLNQNIPTSFIYPPKIITSSIKICPGKYDQGILIQADNIKIECQGSIFDGTNAQEIDGLTIVGGYKNIEVIGCTFQNFRGNGIFLIGGGIPTYKPGFLEEVFIENVKSLGNMKNGLFASANIKKLVISKGEYNKNIENGIQLKTDFVDPALNNLPRGTMFYFANDIRISGNEVSENILNGIVVDGKKYYRNRGDLESERNYIGIEGNNIHDNFYNGILFNSFFVNINPNHWNYADGKMSIIKKNNIHDNSINGIMVIADKNPIKFGSGPYYYPDDISNIDYVVQNNLIGQKSGNGISLVPIIQDSEERVWQYYVTSIGKTWLNVIKGNNQNGIYSTLAYPEKKTYYTNIDHGYIEQNIISSNNINGFYSENPVRTPNPESYQTRTHNAVLICNDILLNPKSGVGVYSNFNRASGFREYLNVYYLNIIEGNNEGIIFVRDSQNKSQNKTGGRSEFGITNNYIGSNKINGIYVKDDKIPKGSQTYHYGGYVLFNDLVSNTLQAYEEDPLLFWAENYWSDYSPTCVDINKDGYCDIPRPILRASNDIKPKVSSFAHNFRGYLTPGIIGIDSSIGCGSLEIP